MLENEEVMRKNEESYAKVMRKVVRKNEENCEENEEVMRKVVRKMRKL